MRVPVWPTWSVWLRQPLLVTAREQPTDAAERGGELLERRRSPRPSRRRGHRRRPPGRGERDAGRALDPIDDDACGHAGSSVGHERSSTAAAGGSRHRRRPRDGRPTVSDRRAGDRPASSSSEPPQRTPRHQSPTVAAIADDGAVRRERHVEDRAARGRAPRCRVGAGGDHGVGRQRCARPGRARRPTPRGRSRRAARGGDLVHDVGAEAAELGGAAASAADHRACTASTRRRRACAGERAGEAPSPRASPARDRAAIVLDEHEDACSSAARRARSRRSTTAGAASGPWPRTTVAACLLGGRAQPHHRQPTVGIGAIDRLDLDLLRGEPALERRVAGQVDALLDADDGGQREPVAPRAPASVRALDHDRRRRRPSSP